MHKVVDPALTVAVPVGVPELVGLTVTVNGNVFSEP